MEAVRRIGRAAKAMRQAREIRESCGECIVIGDSLAHAVMLVNLYSEMYPGEMKGVMFGSRGFEKMLGFEVVDENR